MKRDIHPEYKKAKVTCGCGNIIETYNTVGDLHVEICSVCHPFFTGKQKLVDTAGRVDKFKARMERAEKIKSKAKSKKSGSEKAEKVKKLDEKIDGSYRERGKKKKPLQSSPKIKKTINKYL